MTQAHGPAPFDELFDEESYLARYPDVAEAVQKGDFKSGYDHFVQYGRNSALIGVTATAATGAGRRYSETSGVSRISTDKLKKCELESYFDAHQTGRGIWKWRHYFPVYERYLSRFRNTPVHLMEIGVYSGGSLEMWRRYLGPEAHIYGVDIQPSCKAYEEGRTRIFIGDQGDPTFWQDIFAQVPVVDVVIDDGGHGFHQQAVTLDAVLPRLSMDGVFICEDVHGSDNPFSAYVAGMVPALHSFAPVADPDNAERRSVHALSAFQRLVGNISFYPYMVVLERNPAMQSEFVAPKHGTSWEPFLR